MKIGLTGATGFIGKRIVELAAERGHQIAAFSRDPTRRIPGCEETRAFSTESPVAVNGLDAVVHLAGESVFGLWTRQKKARIRQSRILGTRCVVDGFRRASTPPTVLVSSSAIGFYGETGERAVSEIDGRGTGFLADVGAALEEEAHAARATGARVVAIRTGIVLGPNGGALAVMRPIFRWGGGGELGDGLQWMSWIHLDDIARLYLHAVEGKGIEGALNGVAPTPVRNSQFTDALAQVLHRPALFQVPAWMLRRALGEFSAELLESKRVEPVRTLASGFDFRFPELDAALAHALPD